jgi:hypothetical protein
VPVAVWVVASSSREMPKPVRWGRPVASRMMFEVFHVTVDDP